MSLELIFHEAMVGIYESALKNCNYRATVFRRMVNEHGGVKTAKRLLATNTMQSGLYELFNCGRLDLTVESLVCQPEYQSLFTHEELEEAKRRIEELEHK
ncbi:MAG: hypothetical protein KIH69_011365 [Anaerolineae bacterium]|nr:hypothetical protein [Anaerolineae bacterium]